jgi:diaminohydroxyphosphoribosylaminopyrimidine deaminase/5-amino-6-(5-phosphoribosylamino)uracil reductase
MSSSTGPKKTLSEPQKALPVMMAVDLSIGALPLSDPNPRVGCVIAAADGEVLSTGHTQRAGGPHAEVMALRAARDAGLDVRGATAYVTLEPCSHFGRTPPCCDALIEAGIGKVVVALQDPNPLVAGRGMARLRAAGIDVELLPADHPAALQARELNIGFFSRMVRKTPWVRMKMASSMDGTTALSNGASQWITGPDARADGHAWRARASAVLTGIGTVQSDDPRLDVRLVETQIQPKRVVVDSRLDISMNAKVLQAPGDVLIYTTQASGQQAEKRAALADKGVQVISCGPAEGKVDLPAMLRDLATREVNELHLEAGHKLNGSFLREDLVDEILLYMAPKLLGPGAGLANLGPYTELSQAREFAWMDATLVGTDLRLRARPFGRTDF